MDSETFKAGVAPGAPGTDGEVKTLVCHALEPLTEPLPFDILHEALSEFRLVNYFALIEALESLEHFGNIESVKSDEGQQCYRLTDTGHKALREISGAIPRSIRDKAAKAVSLALKRHKRLSEIIVREERRDGGYLLELAIPDGPERLVSLSLFVPNHEQCNLIKKRFLNDPIYIYKSITALLTGDKSAAGDIVSEEDRLF